MLTLGGSDFSADTGGTGALGGSGADLPIGADITLDFAFNGANTVRLTISANLTSSQDKISDVWVNVGDDTLLTGMTVSHVSGPPLKIPPNVSTGSITVNGAGQFDIGIPFKTGPPADVFGPSDTVALDFVSNGLVFSDFDAFSVNAQSAGPFKAAFHLNVTGNGDSGHYGDVAPVSSIGILGGGIPEPHSLAIWGMLFGLSFLRRKR